MTNSRVFYNKEDLWSIATKGQASAQTQNVMNSAYIVTKLPDIGKDEEFVLMNSYTPSGKDNMVSWLAARMDGENYGKLILYKFPKQRVTYGPSQFKARYNQDPVISKELSLWRQQGSTIIDDDPIIIPIEKSLLYVMSVYIKSTGNNSIPEMKKVIIGYGDKIVMDDTLAKALGKLFDLNVRAVQEPNQPPAGNNPPVVQSGTVSELVKRQMMPL